MLHWSTHTRDSGRLRTSYGLPVVVALLCVSGLASAQIPHPGDDRPDLPAFLQAKTPSAANESTWELPKISISSRLKNTPIASAHRIRVSGFRFRGNTVFPDEELESLAATYANQPISFESANQLSATTTGGLSSSPRCWNASKLRESIFRVHSNFVWQG